MNKAIIGVLVGIAVVGGIVFAVTSGKKDNNPSTTQQTTTPSNETTQEPAGEGTNAPQSNTVAIQNFAFGPETITIKAGTTVTWTNQDSSRHDVTPDQPSDDFKASDALDKGQSYSFTFAKPGTYTYFCSFHPEMKATVVVE